ncbi:MAG TPA: RdgB/HAM1 family non-canonical purine NTP pyrophosphatase [Micropepsaceae bacterium]|nr:RdgB/HAM1 family non-canonical purine NTP pyrophosphatase [Micropepsaceae bacterium]
MIRLAKGQSFAVASHNAGKVREIRDLLAPLGLNAIGAAELNLEEPEETGSSFVQNATLKAEAAAKAANMPALADDSGLVVAALNGEPGIYSARWAGPAKDFRIAMKRVEDEIRATGSHDSRAYFVCALALAAPGEKTETFEGHAYGSLTFPPRGDRGFGYDPIFVPEGHRFTFGEMDPQTKHKISHRAKAFAKFVAALRPGTEQ